MYHRLFNINKLYYFKNKSIIIFITQLKIRDILIFDKKLLFNSYVTWKLPFNIKKIINGTRKKDPKIDIEPTFREILK